MARTRQDSRINTRSCPLKIEACGGPGAEPYWCSISHGLAVGYRKGATGGTWIASTSIRQQAGAKRL